MSAKQSNVARPAGPKARKATGFENRAALAKSTSQGGSAAPRYKGAVRVARFEVGQIDGDAKAVLARWLELSEFCQQITNEIWKQWLLWHELHGTYEKVRQWYGATLIWHAIDKSTRGKKPQIKLETAESTKFIRQKLNERFGTVNSRVKDLTIQRVMGLIRNRKSSRGSLAGWQAIILSHESLPSTTKPQPILFDASNANPAGWLIGEAGEPIVKLRVDRLLVNPGKERSAGSHRDCFAVRTRTKKALRQRLILERVQTGEYDFKGSMLQHDKKKRKWYFLLCYQIPCRKDRQLDMEKTAHLHGCHGHPLLLTIGEREIWIGGRGDSVAAVRRQLFTQRMSRKQNYHNAGSANKGHGRSRALAPVFRLTRRWKDYVKTFNHTSTRKVIEICLEHHIGNLIYHQPVGDYSHELFLAKQGKSKYVKDHNGWDWFGIGTQLKYKGEDFGLQVVVKKDAGPSEDVGAAVGI